MRKLAVFGAFLTILAWSGPLAACPSYMVLTCRDRDRQTAEPAEKPVKTWENRQFRVYNRRGDLVEKGRIETDGTGMIRVYDERGNLTHWWRTEN